ncbi:hypothetical protein [Roseibium sp.]|uniref:hypothetical protein n=1 Tax=Roseibium sp. TaxID=1936156 RepID=UPI003A972DCF
MQFVKFDWVKVLCLALAGVLAASASAVAYEQLSKEEIERILPGHTYQMKVMHPMDLVFFRNGTFKVGHHKPCAGGEKSTYTVSRYGQLKITFRNCNGKKRSALYMSVHKKGGRYFVKDSNTRSYYQFNRRR